MPEGVQKGIPNGIQNLPKIDLEPRLGRDRVLINLEVDFENFGIWAPVGAAFFQHPNFSRIQAPTEPKFKSFWRSICDQNIVNIGSGHTSVHFGSETFPKQFRREFWVTFPPFSACVDQHFGLFGLRGACLRIDKVSRVAARGGGPPPPIRTSWLVPGRPQS